MITLIAAVDTNFAIGKDGDMPWHVPEDLAFFKQETIGGACIMGRKTWDSLPGVLPRRHSIVISRQEMALENAHSTTSVEDALRIAKDLKTLRIYGIGGNSIYTALLPQAERLLLTHLDITITDPDTWFPSLPDAWHPVNSLQLTPQAKVIEYRKTDT